MHTNPVVYLLQGGRNRTYVGATVHLPRRLRQHNGELAGGAARTCGAGPWRLVCHVQGFRTWREALQFEHAWRRQGRSVRRWDRSGREEALRRLLGKERWSSRSPLAAEVDLRVVKEEEDEPITCWQQGGEPTPPGGESPALASPRS